MENNCSTIITKFNSKYLYYFNKNLSDADHGTQIVGLSNKCCNENVQPYTENKKIADLKNLVIDNFKKAELMKYLEQNVSASDSRLLETNDLQRHKIESQPQSSDLHSNKKKNISKLRKKRYKLKKKSQKDKAIASKNSQKTTENECLKETINTLRETNEKLQAQLLDTEKKCQTYKEGFENVSKNCEILQGKFNCAVENKRLNLIKLDAVQEVKLELEGKFEKLYDLYLKAWQLHDNYVLHELDQVTKYLNIGRKVKDLPEQTVLNLESVLEEWEEDKRKLLKLHGDIENYIYRATKFAQGKQQLVAPPENLYLKVHPENIYCEKFPSLLKKLRQNLEEEQKCRLSQKEENNANSKLRQITPPNNRKQNSQSATNKQPNLTNQAKTSVQRTRAETTVPEVIVPQSASSNRNEIINDEFQKKGNFTKGLPFIFFNKCPSEELKGTPNSVTGTPNISDDSNSSSKLPKSANDVLKNKHFQQLVDELLPQIPYTFKEELINAIIAVRDRNNGTLSGLTKNYILEAAELIIQEYGEKMRDRMRMKHAENSMCCLCFRDFIADCRQLNCKHKFHTRCITNWLTKQHCCPTCKMYHTPLTEDKR